MLVTKRAVCGFPGTIPSCKRGDVPVCVARQPSAGFVCVSPMGSPLAPHISAQGSREAVQGEEETERDREQRVTPVHVGVPRTGIKPGPGDKHIPQHRGATRTPGCPILWGPWPCLAAAVTTLRTEAGKSPERLFC